MIVKCEQCQTRFKIPDEKVSDRGVKVRCTKCQHTFRVTRESGTPSGAATAQNPAFSPQAAFAAHPPSEDPFAQFGNPAGGAAFGPEEATRPGMRVPPLAAMQPQALGFEVEDSPTRVGPMPRLGLLKPSRGPLGLSASPSSPPAPQPPAAPEADPFGFADLNPEPSPVRGSSAARGALQRPSELTAPGAPAWPAADPFAAAGAGADPFASFGATAPPDAPAWPAQEALGDAPPQPTREVQAWSQVAPAYDAAAYASIPTGTQPGDAPAPGAQPDDGFEATATGAPSAYGQDSADYAAADGAPPAYADANGAGWVGSEQQVNTDGYGQPSTQQMPTWDPPPAADAPPDQQWDFSAPPADAESAAAASPFDFSGNNLRGEAPAAAPTNPFGDLPPPPAAGDLYGPPGGSVSATTVPYAASPFASASPAPASAEPAPAAAFDAATFGDDPFAAAAPPLSGPAVSDPSPLGGLEQTDASSLFGAPPPPPPEPAPGLEAPAATQAVGRVNLVKKAMPTGEVPAVAPQPGQAPVLAPGAKAAPEEPPEAVKPRRRLAAAAVVVNIVVAAALLYVMVGLATGYLKEGKVELSSLSLSRLKEHLAARQDVVAVDISNGLYETRGGRPVFFVRGEVVNRGEKAQRARVRAELFDGEQLLRSAEGWAGATPSPEDLYAIAAADDVERLAARLLPGARSMTKGESVPFLVPFYEYPADLKGIRVKVVVLTSDPPAPTASR